MHLEIRDHLVTEIKEKDVMHIYIDICIHISDERHPYMYTRVHICKVSENRIPFLDTEIYLHEGKFHTKTDRRETGRQKYSRATSDNEESLKESLPSQSSHPN